MNDDGLPAETGSPVSEDLQQRGIDFLQELLASGKVDLDRFQKALDALLEVHTQADFASVVRSLPPPVEFTPPARRRQEPLEISISMGEVRLEGRWQVSRLTKIDTGMGSVTIDLSQAEFDDWDVEIVVHTNMGTITVIVPRGLEVRPVGRSGAVNTALEPPIPGFPVVRLSATCDMGTIRVMHPTEKKQRRQRWRRRRSKGLPRPCSTHSREPAERHIGFADCCFFCVCFVIPGGCHHARCHVSGEAFRASRGPPAPVRKPYSSRTGSVAESNRLEKTAVRHEATVQQVGHASPAPVLGRLGEDMLHDHGDLVIGRQVSSHACPGCGWPWLARKALISACCSSSR